MWRTGRLLATASTCSSPSSSSSKSLGVPGREWRLATTNADAGQ